MLLAPLRPKKATKCRSCGQSGVHRNADECIAALKVAVGRARVEYPHLAETYRHEQAQRAKETA